jgi:site-specific DNA-methyltransferase (adenine-specific)
MRIVQRTSIEVKDRQRKRHDAKAISDLKASILSKGLLHAPVVAESKGGAFSLVAGEGRLQAMDAIAEQGTFFLHDGKTFLPGEVPVVLLTDLSPADLFEAEFEENEFRTPLDWKDRAAALAKLHELRQETNPSQRFVDTAKEVLSRAPASTLAGVSNPVHLGTRVREAIIISSHLSDPKIANSRNATEALAAILKKESEGLEAELIRRREQNLTVSSLVEVRLGDANLLLPELEGGLFDLILFDPPYGISNNNAGLRGRTIHHHDYSDTPEIARELITTVVQEGFRLTKPRANLFVFGDIDNFAFFKSLCGHMGWVAFRTPITWRKSNEGMAPWGGQGPRRTCEWIFYATKGQKGLLQSPTDVWDFKRVSRDEREYGAEKPLDLLRFMVEISTFPGDYILDPTCGSGTTLQAARQMKRKALGIELDRDAYNLAVVKSQRDVEEPLVQSRAEDEERSPAE